MAHLNLGNALKERGQLAEAITCFQAALHCNPHQAGAHNNLGSAYAEQGRFAEAASCFQQALAIDPDLRLTRWNRCILQLLQGNLEGAWADFELRWGEPTEPARVFEQQRWDGAVLDGKTILVTTEGGLGDTIQFVRYLPLVKCLGATVLLECQPPLQELLADCEGADAVISAGSQLPAVRCAYPLIEPAGDLPFDADHTARKRPLFDR